MMDTLAETYQFHIFIGLSWVKCDMHAHDKCIHLQVQMRKETTSKVQSICT